MNVLSLPFPSAFDGIKEAQRPVGRWVGAVRPVAIRQCSNGFYFASLRKPSVN